MDENEQVFYHQGSDEEGKGSRDPTSPKHAQEALSAEVSKLSVNDKSKAV